jgi:DNA-directed RNA polymerase subunit RPC12/RpoP
MARTRRANRYCIDCGGRLTYYPRLSNPKAPNEHRVLVYACPDCTADFEKPKLLSIRRNQVEDPLQTIEVMITENREKVTLTN